MEYGFQYCISADRYVDTYCRKWISPRANNGDMRFEKVMSEIDHEQT